MNPEHNQTPSSGKAVDLPEPLFKDHASAARTPRKNWVFRAGVFLLFSMGLVFPTGSPIALGLVSVACISCLVAGLFKYAGSDLGVIRLLGYAFTTVFLVCFPVRALFLVVESLTYDTSADVHAGNVALTALSSILVALIYGIVRRGIKGSRTQTGVSGHEIAFKS